MTYSDNDLVYVDPKTRQVIGFLEWSRSGKPKPKLMEVSEKEEGEKRKRRRKQYYPWGTYRSMKRVYRIEGKEKEAENTRTFDEALTKATNEPFWD